MTALLIYLLLALSASFICSIMEASLLSMPISFLRMKAAENNKNAAKFIQFKQDIDKPLSAILVINTIANTLGAAGVGIQATKVFGDAWFGLFSAALAILILFFGEIIPKTIGAVYTKKILTPTVKIISVMLFITYPLVTLANIMTKLLSKKKTNLTTSREEISALTNIGREEGLFEEKEHALIQNILKLKSYTTKDAMTPRTVIMAANQHDSLKDFMSNKELHTFSRIPLYEEDLDDINSYVLKDTVFEKLANDKFQTKLQTLKRPIVKFEDKTSLLEAWNELITKKEHIAVINDQYGGVEGIITLEDIVETIFGMEIIDENDKVIDMQQYAIKIKNDKK